MSRILRREPRAARACAGAWISWPCVLAGVLAVVPLLAAHAGAGRRTTGAPAAWSGAFAVHSAPLLRGIALDRSKYSPRAERRAPSRHDVPVALTPTWLVLDASKRVATSLPEVTRRNVFGVTRVYDATAPPVS